MLSIKIPIYNEVLETLRSTYHCQISEVDEVADKDNLLLLYATCSVYEQLHKDKRRSIKTLPKSMGECMLANIIRFNEGRGLEDLRSVIQEKKRGDGGDGGGGAGVAGRTWADARLGGGGWALWPDGSLWTPHVSDHVPDPTHDAGAGPGAGADAGADASAADRTGAAGTVSAVLPSRHWIARTHLAQLPQPRAGAGKRAPWHGPHQHPQSIVYGCPLPPPGPY
ncbi:hypothetical protein B484DRAFT_163804 [Ochromonadaceae sp. CCMP2298]|nr:hypothetical protein B484DRAFT_163804 [Ochromonadaceae sp. CCMP2298]